MCIQKLSIVFTPSRVRLGYGFGSNILYTELRIQYNYKTIVLLTIYIKSNLNFHFPEISCTPSQTPTRVWLTLIKIILTPISGIKIIQKYPKNTTVNSHKNNVL